MNYSKLKVHLSSIKSQLVQLDKNGKVISSKNELIALQKEQLLVEVFPFLDFFLDEFIEHKEADDLDCMNYELNGSLCFLDFKFLYHQGKYYVYFEDGTTNYLDLQAMQQGRNESVISGEHQTQAQKARELFFQKVNHEIRNPLQSSLGLLKELEKQYKLDGNEYWDVLNQNLNSLKTIANDILDLSKVEEGRMKVYNKRTELQYFLSEVYKRNKLNTRQAGNKLKLVKTTNQNPVLLIDETRLHQVFYNIISNANKYTQNGQIFLKVNSIQSLDTDFSKIEFSISDTGQGMPPEKAKDIFSEFVQIHDSTISLGVGLGLSIVKQIVGLYEGEVWAESAVDKGTTIAFTIKVRNAASLHTLEVKEKLPAMPLKGKDVLLIEDDAMNALIFSKLLQILGATVEIAKNKKEISDVFHTNDVDFVFSDYHLEDNKTIIDIRKELAELQSDAQWILVSGNEFEKTFLEQNNFVGSLVKPISLDDVKQIIQSLPQ